MAIQRKAKQASGGAPEWMVTYGDLVTLLLTFFVLLVSMMEVKSDQQVMAFMTIIREAFGYVGGAKTLPTDELEIPKNVPDAILLQIPILPEDFSPTKDDGPLGKRRQVEIVRPGEYYQSAGKFRFHELSAELPEAEAKRLAEYAEQSLRGYATVIQIRGHCNVRPVDGKQFKDQMDLVLARARVVYDELVRLGIDPRRLRIVGVGSSEPVNVAVYDPADRERNDLVELIQIDQTIDEFQP